jgi:hypothetical protein
MKKQLLVVAAIAVAGLQHAQAQNAGRRKTVRGRGHKETSGGD